MGKQPYIPLYVGDYLKDTRILPLSVRGAWIDLILYMWENPVRGELIGTLEDFARLLSCDRQEAEFALNLLKQKGTADFVLLPDNQIKIISRKMKREAEISQIRSEAGKKGVSAKKGNGFAQAKGKAKHKQNTEYEYEVENEIENGIRKGGVGENILSEESLSAIFNEAFLDPLPLTFKGIDIANELKQFKIKVRGSPDDYQHRDAGGIIKAFLYQLRNARTKNGTNNGGYSKSTIRRADAVIEERKDYGEF